MMIRLQLNKIIAVREIKYTSIIPEDSILINIELIVKTFGHSKKETNSENEKVWLILKKKKFFVI